MSIKVYPVIRLFPGLAASHIASIIGAATAYGVDSSVDYPARYYRTHNKPPRSRMVLPNLDYNLISLAHSICLTMGNVKNPSILSEDAVAQSLLQPETPSASELVHRHYPQVPVEGPVNQEPPDGEITFGKDLFRCMQSILMKSAGVPMTDAEEIFNGLEKVPFDE